MSDLRLTKRGERAVSIAFVTGLVLVMGFVGWLETLGM